MNPVQQLDRPDVAVDDSAPPKPFTPTGLKTVLEVIPDHCYERSAWRGLGLVVRDLAIYAAAITGLALTDNPLLLVPLWLVAGAVVAGLFVLGHDAAHGALFDSSRANAFVARLTMLPSLHATEVWVYGHNRVHHGHTLKQHLDFVWHPQTVEEYRAMSRPRRLLHRVEWSIFGAGLYYLRNIWWNKMMLFEPPKRWRRAMGRDQLLIAVVALLAFGALVGGYGVVGLWIYVKLVVVPFLLFCQAIGWVVYVQHIAPDIRWWARHDWNRFRGQVEGTTVLWGPPGWDLMFHWIMVHIPHHVDMRIPCYRLPEAARAIAAAFPDHVDERPIRLGDYRRSLRACKLYDFEHGRWLTYDAAD